MKEKTLTHIAGLCWAFVRPIVEGETHRPWHGSPSANVGMRLATL